MPSRIHCAKAGLASMRAMVNDAEPHVVLVCWTGAWSPATSRKGAATGQPPFTRTKRGRPRGSGGFLAGTLGPRLGLTAHDRRVDVVEDDLAGHDDLGDLVIARHVEHDGEEDLLHDRAQAAGTRAAQQRLVGDRRDGVLRELEVDAVDLEHLLVLLHERVARHREDVDERLLVERRERRQDGQPADELGDEAELQQVLGHDVLEAVAEVLGVVQRLAETEALATRARLDDLLEAGERTADDEEHVGRVDLDELLVRVLAPTLRWHRGGRALEDLEQGLLDTFAGHVARDRRVLALAGDLVDLVDVDDARLGLLDVVVGGLDELEEDVLDVLADVAGLGQGRRVGDGEGDVEHLGERLRQVRLARAGGADEQDVGLRDVDVVVVALDALTGLDALVVVVDGDGEGLLRDVLPDDVVLEEVEDLARLRQVVEAQLAALGELFLDDLVAQVDALVADVDTGTGDELLDLLLALSAERALEEVSAFSDACHRFAPGSSAPNAGVHPAGPNLGGRLLLDDEVPPSRSRNAACPLMADKRRGCHLNGVPFQSRCVASSLPSVRPRRRRVRSPRPIASARPPNVTTSSPTSAMTSIVVSDIPPPPTSTAAAPGSTAPSAAGARAGPAAATRAPAASVPVATTSWQPVAVSSPPDSTRAKT